MQTFHIAQPLNNGTRGQVMKLDVEKGDLATLSVTSVLWSAVHINDYTLHFV